MFGSFLPSLWSSCNQSVLGSRSRHCYAIKAIGLEPQIEPWLTRFNHASLSRFRIRERRHDNEMNLEKEKVLRDSQHDMGWKAQRTFSLLPVAGEIFPLTFSFIALATPAGWLYEPETPPEPNSERSRR